MLRILSCVAIVLCVAPAWAEQTQPIKALLVTGGCCHDYKAQKQILTEGLSARANVEWDVVYHPSDDRSVKLELYQNANWAEGYDVVVHNECYGEVNDVAFVERIAQAHRKTPAVMLHCSAHSYRNAKTDQWRQVLGITSSSHEKPRPLEVKNLKPKHPIMRGFPTAWTTPTDELYKVDKLWPNTVPLAQAYGEQTQRDHVLIWTNTFHGVPVFGTTLGHGNATMESEEFLDLVARGLLWTVGKLDDQGRPAQGYAGRSSGE